MKQSVTELKHLAQPEREATDFSYVREGHAEIHERLVNWSRWCRESGRGTATHPMFRGYRNDYDEAVGGGHPVDTLNALAVQKAYIQLPEKHRWALMWWYCRPYIPVMRVRQALALTTPALSQLIHDSRTMMKNIR